MSERERGVSKEKKFHHVDQKKKCEDAMMCIKESVCEEDLEGV